MQTKQIWGNKQNKHVLHVKQCKLTNNGATQTQQQHCWSNKNNTYIFTLKNSQLTKQEM